MFDVGGDSAGGEGPGCRAYWRRVLIHFSKLLRRELRELGYPDLAEAAVRRRSPQCGETAPRAEAATSARAGLAQGLADVLNRQSRALGREVAHFRVAR
jgi:hypothetical protein